MVLKTTKDAMGSPYGRVDASNITCPRCGQDVDPSNRERFVHDRRMNRLYHRACIADLWEYLQKEDAAGITLEE